MFRRSSVIFGILLSLMVIKLSSAVDLNCSNKNAQRCKKKFSELFDKDSKAIHVTYSINRLQKYVDVYKAILDDLPQNDKHRDPLTRKITELTSKIKSYNEGQENIQDTVDLLLSLNENFEPNFDGINFSAISKAKYNASLKKHSSGMLEFEGEESLKVYDQIMNLWFQLYSGLREKDFKTYSEYAEINVLYKGLQAAEPKWKSMIYWGAVEKTTEFLDLVYLKKVLDKLHEAMN